MNKRRKREAKEALVRCQEHTTAGALELALYEALRAVNILLEELGQ